ncbi:MAG TPA: hypothetical protein PLI62_12665 [Spirochaetota bacterium]|nr:hypothetical protein [Spirochaetota bacterium]
MQSQQEAVAMHEGAHFMNRSSFTSLLNSKCGECSSRSKARRRLSRGMGAPLGEGQRPSPRDMRSIS